jgi:hypothetical protein
VSPTVASFTDEMRAWTPSPRTHKHITVVFSFYSIQKLVIDPRLLTILRLQAHCNEDVKAMPRQETNTIKTIPQRAITLSSRTYGRGFLHTNAFTNTLYTSDLRA